MILYSRQASPFAAFVRFALYAKNLTVDVIEIAETSAAGFPAINPLRKVPVLMTNEGLTIPESLPIAEYLEDAYPAPSLLPGSPGERAQLRLLVRLADLYLFPASMALLKLRFANQADPDELSASKQILSQTLGYIEQLLPSEFPAGRVVAAGPSLADGALAAFLFYARFASPSDPLAAFPRLATYWNGLEHNEPANRIIRELTQAVAQ